MKFVRTHEGIGVEVKPGATGPGSVLPIRHIVCVGMNYSEHAREQGKGVPERPVLFTKNPLSAILNGDDIVIPKVCQDRPQVDFEGELAVLVAGRDGAPVRNVAKAAAYDAVLGYAVANDVSARWWQKEGSGGQFYRGKSFDTFCPLGPAIVPAAQIKDPHELRLTTKVNGQVMQNCPTRDMIFDIPTLVHEITRGTTLPAVTVILTGTPCGVGMARSPQVFLKSGDVVEITIDPIGTLKNTVREE